VPQAPGSSATHSFTGLRDKRAQRCCRPEVNNKRLAHGQVRNKLPAAQWIDSGFWAMPVLNTLKGSSGEHENLLTGKRPVGAA